MTLPINTKRLLLRRFTPADLPDLLEFVAHPSVANEVQEMGTSEAQIADYIEMQNSFQPFEPHKVFDLGIDVPQATFIEAAQEHKPAIVGLGAYMSTTMLEMENVINALEEQGLRNGTKIMVGGVPTSQEFCDEIGADAWGKDALQTMQKALELVGG